jgi:transposase
MNLHKQSIGIDISKDTFTACLASLIEHGQVLLSEVGEFPNTPTGFNRLLRWVRSMADPQVELVFLMESTGVYYQRLAHHLYSVGKTVHVVLPNKSAHYGKSLNIKTKTDYTDARLLARFGVERVHRPWSPPPAEVDELRQLTRYYVQLQEQKTALNNMMHAKDVAHATPAFILASNKQLIKQVTRQIERCKQQVRKLITANPELDEVVSQLSSIKGLGWLTAAVVLAETRMFEGITSGKQLASYAGYDVTQRESGSSVKGTSRISKKGNRYIRNALYFPAMVATRFNPDLKEFYHRVNQGKPSKMIGQVAVQRKLLMLMFALHKNGTTWQPGYHKIAPTHMAEATQDSIAGASTS